MAFWKNPRHEANKYLNQIPGVSHQTYDPYIQQGQQAGQQLGQQYGQMAMDPAAFYEQLMQRYQPSRQFEMQNQAQQNAAANAAAAGGMRGTQSDIANSAQIADRLMGEDMQRWYGNVSGLLGAGMQGQQNMYNTGFSASQGLGGDLMNALGQQGGLAFQNANAMNQNKLDILKGLLGSGMAAASMGMPGGGTLGGTMASNWMK